MKNQNPNQKSPFLNFDVLFFHFPSFLPFQNLLVRIGLSYVVITSNTYISVAYQEFISCAGNGCGSGNFPQEWLSSIQQSRAFNLLFFSSMHRASSCQSQTSHCLNPEE
jgi:hypothetical protein